MTINKVETTTMNAAIYFDDLNEQAQKALLEFYGIDSPDEMNWDVVPIVVITP